MTRLPPPPTDLASRELPIQRIRGSLFRIHQSTHDYLFFSRDGSGRFDDALKKFGVLYAAFDAEGAFSEVFLRRLSQMLIPESALNDRVLSQISCKTVECVDLTGSGLRQLSCDNRISTEIPYQTTCMWSRALFEHPQKPGGIIYLSRHNPQCRCVALFDRSRGFLKLKSSDGLMRPARRAWTLEQITKYNLAIEPAP